MRRVFSHHPIFTVWVVIPFCFFIGLMLAAEIQTRLDGGVRIEPTYQGTGPDCYDWAETRAELEDCTGRVGYGE